MDAEGPLETSVPVQSFAKTEKLAEGEIVKVELGTKPGWSDGLLGRKAQVVVSAYDMLGAMMPSLPLCEPSNRGRHVIHTGGDHASYLRLPI